ncbi:MAG TPA: outer membrane beta-barrel protein [Solimonas sp.]
MTMSKMLGAGLLALAPVVSHAGAPGYFDLYFIPQANLEVTVPGFGSADEDGDGFGGKLMAPVSEMGVLSAEYQAAKLDDSDTEIKQLRFGLGVMTNGPARLGALAEYINMELEVPGVGKSKPDGFGLHGRLEFDVAPGFVLHGQVGYVNLKEDGSTLEGLEINAGVGVAFTSAVGLFLDYRLSQLEDETDVELDLSDLRVGFRVNFGP